MRQLHVVEWILIAVICGWGAELAHQLARWAPLLRECLNPLEALGIVAGFCAAGYLSGLVLCKGFRLGHVDRESYPQPHVETAAKSASN